MKALLLSAALALAPGLIEPQEPAQGATQAEEQADAPSAPPKAPVAGLTGFRSKSRLVRSSDPDRVLLLEAFYVFPARVRWSLIPEGAPATQRRLDFRFGDDYWTLAPGQAASQPLEPTADVPNLGWYDHSHRGWTDVHMELRRAAMLWPDGLAWEGEGSLRIARSPVVGHVTLHGWAPEPVPLVLRARLDGDGRPEEIRAQGAPHGGVETFETGMALGDITWRQDGQRWWPHTFTLVGYGEEEWHETVESVDTAVNALDSFFVPHDRKSTAGTVATKAATLVRLPPVIQRRVPLAGQVSWEEATAAAERHADEEAARIAPLGGELAKGMVLELHAAGTPQAVLLRLARAPEPLPEGWQRIAAREGLTSRRTGGGPVPVSTLQRLRSLLPEGAEAGLPYVKVASDTRGGTTCQVVLPFRRPD